MRKPHVVEKQVPELVSEREALALLALTCGDFDDRSVSGHEHGTRNVVVTMVVVHRRAECGGDVVDVDWRGADAETPENRIRDAVRSIRDETIFADLAPERRPPGQSAFEIVTGHGPILTTVAADRRIADISRPPHCVRTFSCLARAAAGAHALGMGWPYERAIQGLEDKYRSARTEGVTWAEDEDHHRRAFAIGALAAKAVLEGDGWRAARALVAFRAILGSRFFRRALAFYEQELQREERAQALRAAARPALARARPTTSSSTRRAA